MKIILLKILWSAIVVAGVGFALKFLNERLVAYYHDKPHLAFRRQLIQVGAFMLALLLILLFVPISDTTRGQLLSLYGIIVSATIALSSTTLVGNVMAGLMLRMVGNIKPGDYVRVGEYFGRISEMDLLHTEIQTEERDLTTLPNLYLVQNPVRVMQSSGTILSVQVGLGYDVPRTRVEALLLEAATATGLEKPFVQIVELGDYAVTYKVAGLLVEANKLIAKRRELRAHTIDHLHQDGIEIASPTLMSTRAFDKKDSFTPPIRTSAEKSNDESNSHEPDALVFDKAAKAESVSKLKEKLSELEARHKECAEVAESNTDAAKAEAALKECESLQNRIDRLKRAIDQRETQISSS